MTTDFRPVSTRSVGEEIIMRGKAKGQHARVRPMFSGAHEEKRARQVNTWKLCTIGPLLPTVTTSRAACVFVCLMSR